MNISSLNVHMRYGIQFLLMLILTQLEVNATQDNFFRGFSSQSQKCVPIPPGLSLCKNLQYKTMMLPNLLHHDKLEEVQQQASSFVPLSNTKCHPHLEVFLCSLFAPVCLKDLPIPGPIPPCRSLCKTVERHCKPIMNQHGFPWPEMLNCSKFTDEEPCVHPGNTTATPPPPTDVDSFTTAIPVEISTSHTFPLTNTTNICAPCRTKLRNDTLLDNFCASEFVLKIRVKRLKIKNNKGIRELQPERKKKAYKLGSIKKADIKRKQLKFYLNGTKRCICPQLDSVKTGKKGKRGKKGKAKRGKKTNFLIMGRKDDRKFLITVIHAWDKKNKKILNSRASKKVFKGRQCPTFGEDAMSVTGR